MSWLHRASGGRSGPSGSAAGRSAEGGTGTPVGWSLAAGRILLLLATTGGTAHLALSSCDVTNALEQLYRERGGGPPDPEKFSYNVCGVLLTVIVVVMVVVVRTQRTRT